MVVNLKTKNDPASPTNHLGTTIRDLLAGWDRAGFGVCCRTMEVLLLRGECDRARKVLDRFIRRQAIDPPTLRSHVDEVLPERISGTLVRNGYLTLEAVDRASDADLLLLREIGPHAVGLIRDCIAAIRSGRALPVFDDTSDLHPDWELPDSSRVSPRLETPPPSCSRVSPRLAIPLNTEGTPNVPNIKEALAVLMESSGDALSEIDAEIASLTADIEQLKRMRKLLAPAGTTKRNAKPQAGGDYRALALRMVDAIKQHGPAKAKVIGERIGEDNYGYLGRCVRNCPDLLVKAKDGVIMLANAG